MGEILIALVSSLTHSLGAFSSLPFFFNELFDEFMNIGIEHTVLGIC